MSCRNLLIYLNRDAQNRALDIFHFALNPDGVLFLGSSESVEDGNPLFTVLDKKHRLYCQEAVPGVGLAGAAGPSTLLVRQIEERAASDHASETGDRSSCRRAGFSHTATLALAARAGGRDARTRVDWSELHFKLLERFGPPSVLVDREARHPAPVRERGTLPADDGRRADDATCCASCIRRCASSCAPSCSVPRRRVSRREPPRDAVRLDRARTRRSTSRVFPASEIAAGLPPGDVRSCARARRSARVGAGVVRAGVARRITSSTSSSRSKGHLRDTVEQYEASTEELKASNEELQAMNEELRSATEELETSREELQSINEELTTVNQESRSKVDELAHANSDLQNLMSATAIATLFLDRDLRVMRFTDSAAPIFNLIPGDIGRPLSDLQHRLDYPEMADGRRARAGEADARRARGAAPGTGRPILRACCRTARYDDRIAGVVLTFVDITERERTKRDLAEDLAATERLRAVAERVVDDDSMQGLFNEIVEAAIFVTHADAGMVQLLDEEQAVAAAVGVEGLPERSASTAGRTSTSTARRPAAKRCARAGARSWTSPTRTPADVEGVGPLASRSGRACAARQSTPLVARAGAPIGVITTHWKTEHAPSDRELRFLDLLVRQAADAVERQQAREALRVHLEELQRFNQAAVGRETRMIELKKEINELAKRLGESPRYSLDFEKNVD